MRLQRWGVPEMSEQSFFFLLPIFDMNGNIYICVCVYRYIHIYILIYIHLAQESEIFMERKRSKESLDFLKNSGNNFSLRLRI